MEIRTLPKNIHNPKQIIANYVQKLSESNEFTIHWPSDLLDYDFSMPAINKAFSFISSDSDMKKKFVLVFDQGTDEIPDKAFSSCDLFYKAVIPSSVKRIGESAFSMCPIEEFDIEDGSQLASIGREAFAMTEIKEFVMPDSVLCVGPFAFSGCPNLEKITISSKVDKIPVRMCSGCTNLTEVVVSGQITEIGNFAFNDCSLSDFDFKESISQIGIGAFKNNKLTKVDLSTTQVIAISKLAFAENAIEHLSIPYYVQYIGNSAFAKNLLPSEEIDQICGLVTAVECSAFESQDS